MTFFYFGIHKAASTWLINILNDINLHLNYNYLHFHSEKHFDYDLNKQIDENQLGFVSYTNAEYETVKSLNTEYKGFHVIRDPRDIIVSSYYSHLNSHSDYMWPEINEYRAELKSLNKDDGIMATIHHLENLVIDKNPVRIFDFLRNWNYEDPNILEIKFEEITKNPYVIFPEIFEFLGLIDQNTKTPTKSIRNSANSLKNILASKYLGSTRKKISLPELLHLIYKHDFYFKTKGRKKGVTDEKSHYRKGEINDWKNHLNSNHINYIKDNFNDILIQLGYEKNSNW